MGRDMATYLSEKGYDLILVARRKERLMELQKELKTKSSIITLDISNIDNCYKLYDLTKNEDIDILINNAGFGVFGYFTNTNVEDELRMIDTNVKAVHVLTKLYLNDFKKKNKGYILNVASLASFTSGPLMATYYASKGYVLKLTEAIYEELRRQNSKVYIGCLCPGPVNTEFNDVAKVKFGVKALSSKYVSKYAIDKMFKHKTIIIPGVISKLTAQISKFIPRKILLRITYKIQKKKEV